MQSYFKSDACSFFERLTQIKIEREIIWLAGEMRVALGEHDMLRATLVAALLCAVPTTAFAGDKLVVQPVQVGPEQVRYNRGDAMVTLDTPTGSVQIQPLPFDHGGMAFGIAVFNAGAGATNFDISNVTITVDGAPVQIYSRHDLEKKAKNRAMWKGILVGLAGGLSAVAAANQRDTYTATTYGRYGTYRTVIDTPSSAGQVQAAAITAGTAYGLVTIRNQLDQTLAMLGEQTVQLTTIDPGDSYAGRLVLAKVKFNKKAVPVVRMNVNLGGVDYPFGFRVVRNGTPAPVFVPVAAPAVPAAEPTASVATPGPVLVADRP
ncbi:hypothetical protein Q9Q95_13465 [Sphingomonas sp. DG1-23]|uniref:hypothetical protein n=1 Tax=Sphingomonas sp. DG1-23 TaxID=3068316 RepID=UPI00273DE2D6|nr:hypothetical protein [Sphingomonas sp. DG1-23]MDP5279938.1 hypothetical protein [Sphingomonas sp. DG1-23]